jgi:hypothetical protein
MKVTLSKIPVLALLGAGIFATSSVNAQMASMASKNSEPTGDTVNIGEVTITATGLTTSSRKTGYGVSQVKGKSVVSSG